MFLIEKRPFYKITHKNLDSLRYTSLCLIFGFSNSWLLFIPVFGENLLNNLIKYIKIFTDSKDSYLATVDLTGRSLDFLHLS